MSKNDDINIFFPILDDRACHDGGKKQILEMETKLAIEHKEKAKKELLYREYLKRLLQNAPVISVVSEDALRQMYDENKIHDFINFAINVARITEENLLKINIICKNDVITTFETTINSLCLISEKDTTHFTYLTVNILHNAWIYGEVVRQWWNSRFLHGEIGENYTGIYDYRQNDRNISYRISSNIQFPG